MPKAKPDTTKAKTPHVTPGPNNAITVPKADTETGALAAAKAILAPDFRHGMAASQLHAKGLGTSIAGLGLGDYADAMKAIGNKAAEGELAFVSRMLASQAVTLDNVFTEMTRRAAMNMGEYIGATDTYMRIAIKAQANSRATLEALTKLHQPREQTVRHVHVNEGGQAVIADQFHHHTGVEENGKSIEQPQATGTADPGTGAALPSPDPLRNGVPIASRARQAAVQDARREG